MVQGEHSKTQKEDEWAWVEIGEPFPDGPMRVKGEQNQYVALWYKHGKPVCGRAWNNGGTVESSFPFKGKELTGKNQLGGKIQILAYPFWKDELVAWRDFGYTYKWVLWKERNEPFYQPVRCGNSSVILFKGDDGQNYSGDIDVTTELAQISYKGKTNEKTTGIGNLFTIVRDIREPPSGVLEYFDVWVDLKEGDDFNKARFPVKALDRPLKTPEGPKEMFIALWYKHGIPVAGRVWNNNDKIAASFASHSYEHTSKIGSLQILVYNPSTAGFKLSWQPYHVAAKKGSGWFAVRVDDSAPCIIEDGGFEWLGCIKVKQEIASYGTQGKEKTFEGGAVKNFMVLCRNSPVPGATE